MKMDLESDNDTVVSVTGCEGKLVVDDYLLPYYQKLRKIRRMSTE